LLNRKILILVAALFLPGSAFPQQPGQSVDQPQSTHAAGADASGPIQSVSGHRFWDRTNIMLFSGIAVLRGLDYASTRNFLRRGRTEQLLPDDVVNNSAAFSAVEAGGAATSVALSYLFHRTGHHKMERWLSVGHISVTGVGVIWNYSIKTKRHD
jgi:hypothetical protein